MNETIMLSEIKAQPELIKRCMETNKDLIKEIGQAIKEFKPTNILIAARETSLHSGILAKYLFQLYYHLPVSIATPSVFTVYDGEVDLSKTLVIAIITDEKVKAKMESALNEVKARKAKTLVFTNLSIKDSLIDYQYTLPKLDTLDSQIISCIPLQLLAYYVSTQKGINPDKPKNLAKSVTVE